MNKNRHIFTSRYLNKENIIYFLDFHNFFHFFYFFYEDKFVLPQDHPLTQDLLNWQELEGGEVFLDFKKKEINIGGILCTLKKRNYTTL